MSDFKCICGKICKTSGGLKTHQLRRCEQFKKYIFDKLSKEFFDEYIGRQNIPLTIISKEILQNEFSYYVVVKYAKLYDYTPLSSSEAMKNKYTLNKMAKTMIKKLGVSNPSQSEKIKKKKKETMIRNFGVEHHLKLKSQREKQKQTNIKKYGKENVSQVDLIHKKKEETFQKHYGYRNIFCDSDLIKQFYIDKFGVDNPSKLSWVEQKKFETLMKNYGVDCFNALSLKFSHSKMSLKLFDSIYSLLCEELKECTKYHNHNSELKVYFDRKSFAYLDFSILIRDVKIVIEFNGDYWHMNPSNYSKNDYNSTVHMEAYQIWQKDNIRKNKIEQAGFKLLTIWESEYTTNSEQTLNKCLSFIQEHIPEAIN